VTRTGTTPPIPTLTVPAGKTTLEATGASGAAANLTSLVVAKKSTGVALTPTCTPSLNSTFAFGNTTVNCSVTDSGYTVARSFTVVVADTKAPTMTLPTLLPVASQGTTGGAHVPFTVAATDVVDGCVPPSSSALAPGATPPCTPTASSGTIVCAPASNSVFAAGTTAVTCRATDKTGNVGTATFNVVVTDVSPPKLTVPSLVTAEATDFLGARVTYAVSAVDAEDGARPVDCAAPSGSLFLLGDSTVTCQASDTAGNTVRASFTVRVVDTTPPTVSAPATITNEANDARGFAVPLPVTAYDSVSMALTPVCTRTDGFNTVKPVASGDWFQVGETLVTCRATDAAGNVGSATIDVIVTDTTAPVITPPAPPVRARVTGDGTAQVTFVATATDRNGTVGVPVVCTPPSGSHFAFGNTTVNCVARDDAGNEARKSFVVTVYDDTPPVISNVPAPPVAYATSTAGAKVTYTLPTSIDGYEGVRPVACTPASGATFAPNKTTVTCTSADTSKNTATATFTVWVQFDTRQPDGTTFLGLAADGSTIYGRNSVIPVAFALTGASKPITTAVAQATIAPIAADGTVGAFVAAPNGAGTGTVFTYSTTAANYGFALATASLTPGRYRFRADLADGAPHDVDFTLSANSFTLAPLGFTFPPTVIGQQSPPAGFTVVNITTSPISVTSTLAVQVGGASEVQLVANGCTASLAPRAACPVTVVMMPASPGPKNAQLTISAGAGDALTAQISGIAWRPAQLAASPPSISMGSAPFLTPSPTLGDVTVTNVGDQPLGMLNLNLSNPEFAISSNQCPPSLPGGQSCHVLVRFTPTAVGARGGTLSLGAGPGGTATVSLAGTGLPPLVMTPTSFTFPGVTVGAAGPSQTFTVSNIAAVVSPSLTTSTSVAAFRITANTCAGRPLVAGSPCSITVQWFPTVKGTVGGALTVTGGASPWTVASSLTGTGL
jgi:hypothetical protein